MSAVDDRSLTIPRTFITLPAQHFRPDSRSDSSGAFLAVSARPEAALLVLRHPNVT